MTQAERRAIPWNDLGLLFLRVTVGLMMASHGWDKLLRYADKSSGFPDPLGVGPPLSMALAIVGELFCALAVALGLWTRWAAVPVAFTMLVAAGVIHAADPWSQKEFPLLYAVVFLTLVLTGPGRFSISRLWHRRSGA